MEIAAEVRSRVGPKATGTARFGGEPRAAIQESPGSRPRGAMAGPKRRRSLTIAGLRARPQLAAGSRHDTPSMASEAMLPRAADGPSASELPILGPLEDLLMECLEKDPNRR